MSQTLIPQSATKLGDSPVRMDAKAKVHGVARYARDYSPKGVLHASLVTSPQAHAKIKSILVSQARGMPGVKAVLTASDVWPLTGVWMEDRPMLAYGKVRYYGEPVAVVIANRASEAESAAAKVKVEYEPLPVVNTVKEALAPDAPLIHENMARYDKVKPFVYPQKGTNICHMTKIRKGNMEEGWASSDVIIEKTFDLPQSDHAAMETRSAVAEIQPDGQLVIHAASQAPFVVRRLLGKYFGVPNHKIVMHTPLVGGSFGGKCSVQLEPIAVLASQAVGGKPVKVTNSRKQDMVSSPIRVGLLATVKLGASRDGTIQAAEITYHVNIGAYSDMGVVMSKSIAADCTGPYRIENLKCDSYAVYTNRTYVTSFRGFGHAEYTFCVERAMDALALALQMDPLDLRLKNTIKEGDTSPTGVSISPSIAGDVSACLTRLREIVGWDGGQRIVLPGGKIIARGISCFWKAPSTASNARSGAIITTNTDGTLNLNIGSVEMGQGSKTGIAQMLAAYLRMDIEKIHVNMDIDTSFCPVHWKTVASATTYLAGRSVLAAADKFVEQVKRIAAGVLRYDESDLDVGGGRVYVKSDPDVYLDFQSVVQAYEYADGASVGGQVIAQGSYSVPHLAPLDKETGKGRSGPSWTVGAQAAEVEFDPEDCSYKVFSASSVIDAGKLVNPSLGRGVVMGGMAMGLGLGTREELIYTDAGVPENPNLRQYRLLRCSEAPRYQVEFVETPQVDGPLGARGFGEHGIIGIPAAVANALSRAAEVDLDRFPIVPEFIWRARQEVSER